LRNEWSVVRSESLAKGGTSKQRLSLHFHKVPTQRKKMNLQTLQTALVHGVNDVRQTEMVTAESLVPEPSCFKVEITIEKL